MDEVFSLFIGVILVRTEMAFGLIQRSSLFGLSLLGLLTAGGPGRADHGLSGVADPVGGAKWGMGYCGLSGMSCACICLSGLVVL